MGALTFKPLAYQGRPWELFQVQAFNYFRNAQSEPVQLLLQIRNNFYVSCAQASGWINDKTRFMSDGFRRQRLTSLHSGQEAVSWTRGLSLWWALAPKHLFWSRCDGWVPFHGAPLRLYQSSQLGRRLLTVSYDMFLTSEVYHGVHGFAKLSSFVGLSLPGCHPYEEEGLLSSPRSCSSWREWSFSQSNLLSLVTRISVKSTFGGIKQNLVSCYHAASWKNLRFSTKSLSACLKVSSFQQILAVT